MAWKVDGKIAYLATEQQGGNPQQDTYRILYQAPGQNTQEEIEKVYYLAPGGNPATDLQLVWHRYMDRTLLGGDALHCIEFIPKQNVVVSHIGIFTDDEFNSTSVHVKIFHESGFIVSATDVDVYETAKVHELQGYIRTATINNVTLFAGHKYYICYVGNGGNFYPAYYQDEVGTYKNYTNSQTAEQVTIRTLGTGAGEYNPTLYKGLLTTTQGIWNFTENSWFTWVGDSSHSLNYGHVYIRSNVGNNITFMGVIGDENSNYHPITKADLLRFISLPYIPNKEAAFMWCVHNYSSLTFGNVYSKNFDTTGFATIDYTTYSDNDNNGKIAATVLSLQANTYVMGLDGNINYSNAIGKTFNLKTGYTCHVTSMTPDTTLPANPVDKGLYYLNGSIGEKVGHQTAIFVYDSSNDKYIQIHNQNFDTYFDTQTLDGMMTFVGTPQDAISTEIDTGLYTFFTVGTTNTRNYYLEINGNEVS